MTDIEHAVCQDILQRQIVGIAKYGTTVAANPLELRAWLQHAYEECLDQAVYLKRAIAEIDAKEWERNGATGDSGTADCSTADRSRYEIIVGPIEPGLDGFTAEDRKEWLEDAGWQSVQIRWIE